jgi:hypothetical protein
VLFEEHDIGPADLREMIENAGADDAATDDYGLRMGLQDASLEDSTDP